MFRKLISVSLFCIICYQLSYGGTLPSCEDNAGDALYSLNQMTGNNWNAIIDKDIIAYYDENSIAASTSDKLLIIASKIGHLKLAQYALNHGANINVQDDSDTAYTPLGYVAWCGFDEMADWLMKHGGNVNATQIYYSTTQGVKMTALMLALMKQDGKKLPDFTIANELLDRSADACFVNNLGLTIVDYGSLSGNAQVKSFAIKAFSHCKQN